MFERVQPLLSAQKNSLDVYETRYRERYFQVRQIYSLENIYGREEVLRVVRKAKNTMAQYEAELNDTLSQLHDQKFTLANYNARVTALVARAATTMFEVAINEMSWEQALIEGECRWDTLNRCNAFDAECKALGANLNGDALKAATETRKPWGSRYRR